MSTKKPTRKLPTRFAPETRFNVSPSSNADAATGPTQAVAKRALDAELETLKNRLLRNALHSASDLGLTPALRRAANEAASLAWLTSHPLLVLPELLQEKVGLAKTQAARQSDIRHRSRSLLSEAA